MSVNAIVTMKMVIMKKNEFIRHLINRANQFGLQDLLDELKYEGDRVGAYLNIKGGAL